MPYVALALSMANQAKANQQQANKALHPTAYSFVRRASSLSLAAAGELGRCAVARYFSGSAANKSESKVEIQSG